MTRTHLPRKLREYENRFFDSTAWNDFKYRDGDIVIASYAKAGTTLLQQIVSQLIFNGAEEIDVSKISPWLDSVHPDKATKIRLFESQDHRRFIKTHLPAESLVFSGQAKYLYIGRDGRDIAWSLYAHQLALSQNAQATLDKDGNPSGRLRVIQPPSSSVVEYFDDWLEKNGHPFWPFWENIRSWWAIRDLPNVLFIHFSRLLDDLPGEVRKIAEFIGTPIEESRRDSILSHCGFQYMKENAARYVPQGTGLWKDGGKAFFHQGQNGRWRGTLPPEASQRYERRAVAELGSDCAHWLVSGDTENLRSTSARA
ncbi:sulfotransferase domain-containing protein [Paracidovorax anthurii]|uniref:Aryl sulfotransferase n=1 Tax=Paracidovorax anthurii TaxID=78229 RepID=A0A328ZH40_9BURK|nr:sulfotransferase domain-containing protein [Paracidovorax anthurii]RAR85558.1 aryl sulfotransferase [Paracidovorax anthurii]